MARRAKSKGADETESDLTPAASVPDDGDAESSKKSKTGKKSATSTKKRSTKERDKRGGKSEKKSAKSSKSSKSGKSKRSGSSAAIKRPSPAHQFAAIDIGATSVRMQVAEWSKDKGLRTLDELVHPVSLGTDTFTVGHVTPPSLHAVCEVVRNFNNLLGEYGVRRVRAVATSAVREASNRDIVIDRVRHASGLELEVLEGVEETRLTCQIIQPFLEQNLGCETTLCLDLGGGSTEVLLLSGCDLVGSGSRRLGTARLFHTIAHTDVADAHALLESVIRNVVNQTASMFAEQQISALAVINTQLRRALAGQEEVEAVAGGLRTPVAVIDRLAKQAESLTPGQLADAYELTASGADLLVPALMILRRFLKRVPVEQVHVLEVDLLHGVLQDMTQELRGKNPALLFAESIIRSAEALGRKYHHDEDHAAQVSRLAIMLYEGLAEFLDLAGKDRLYLEVAAKVHDIGMFIAESAHHKHSMYLVRHSEIVGLSADERHLVSLICRYHRKAHPRPQHEEFAALPMDQRLKVIKLAALLRVADALDRGHRQVVKRLECEFEENRLLLRATARDDMVVEIEALRSKGNLFQEITGLGLELRPVAG